MKHARGMCWQLSECWRTESIRTRVIAIVICAVALVAALHIMSRSSQRGAPSIEQLVELYERAHRKESLRELRPILWWNASGLNRTGSWDGEERLMQGLFDMPLAEVKLVKSPPLDYENSGEAAYSIPGSRKADSMTGNIYGKLLLVEAVEGGREPRTVDPAYIVLRSREKGEYFIHILPLVTEDAVLAYQNNTEPKYVAAPLAKFGENFELVH